jgi:formylglycine-generating enzyme required for sulfatase activity
MEPVMVRIEPTDHEFDFQMGSSFPGAKPDELPPVRIKFPGAFHLSTTEVTYQQYDQFAQATDRPLPVRAPEGLESNDRYPVAHVSWEDARDYAQWLRDETDVPYRLPTEAEWEYVARAGSTSKYPWGDLEENASNFANCMDCGDLSTRGRGSLPVDMNKEGGTRELQPNRLGLYDMQGNVAEWVQDCWSDDLTQQNLQGAALVIPGCRRHVHRGGSWQVPARELYSSNRGSYDGKDLGIGFRLAADEE